MKKLKNNDKELCYKVVEKDTKHSYIKPQNGYVLITKSKNMQLDYILNRLMQNFDYYYNLISKTLEDVLYLWNKPYKLEIKKAKNFSYQINNNKIIVTFQNNDYQKIKKLILTEELNKYLKNIKGEVEKKLQKENYYVVPIKLKLLKSKYGSYNVNKGNEYIILNVFLATLSPEFTLYVLYHEYAHQKVKNHQKEFYRALDKLFKEHRKYQKALKQYRLII